MQNAQGILKELGLSEAETKLYLALQSAGAQTAGELAKRTKAKRPTIYYALRQLEERGLIHKVGSLGVERFQAERGDKLLTVLTLRRQKIDALEAEVHTLIPVLEKRSTQPEAKPAILFYEGEEAMKQAIMDTLYCRDGHIDSIAPGDNFFWQIGQVFSKPYIDERVQRGITTRNLWERPLEPAIMLKSYSGLSHVRILPEAMHAKFRTTVFLYDDVVMYISSLDSGYVLLVRSKEHHELMKAIYEALWLASTATNIS